MGKQKRARQKFHLASIKWRNDEEKAKLMDVDKTGELEGVSCLNPLKADLNLNNFEDVFKGVGIEVNQLKTSLLVDNDDAVSVRSIAKTLKSVNNASGTRMKKVMKRKLRHNLFIQKIDALYQDMKKNKKGYKKLETSTTSASGNDSSLLQESKSELDGLNLGEFTATNRPESSSAVTNKSVKSVVGGAGTKRKGIQKTKKRKKEMLKDYNVFKKLMSETSQLSYPLDAITAKVEEKVLDGYL